MNPVSMLAAHSGDWRGSNTLHDPNTGQSEESPSTVTVTPILNGRFVRIDYTWGYRGQPQEGSLLIGFNAKSNEVSGHWIDTWHMGHAALNCLGSPGEIVIVRGSYPAPDGPDWGWRIEIEPQAETLRIRHTNIDSEGDEYPAVEGVYSR